MKRYAAIALCVVAAALGLSRWGRQARSAGVGTEPVGSARENAEPEPSAPVASSARAELAPLAPPLLDEPALMAELRLADSRDPELALALARDGNARFGDSPDAAERAALAVKALARTGHLSQARGEAEIMVNRYPDTPWAREVEAHTGAHPHRSPSSQH
jgi:hypothetical protein